jgi:hypothetical protein
MRSAPGLRKRGMRPRAGRISRQSIERVPVTASRPGPADRKPVEVREPRSSKAGSAAGSGTDIRALERQCESSTAAWMVRYHYLASVRPHNFFHDREPEPGTSPTRLLTAPEAIKNVIPLFRSHPRAVIGDANASFGVDFNDDLGIRRCMTDRVLDQISNRILDRVPTTLDEGRSLGTDNGDRAFLSDC